MDKGLFIPLKRKFYQAFIDGSKGHEYRRYGPRWNEKTCFVGRMGRICLGYSGEQTLVKVTSFEAVDLIGKERLDYEECYGPDAGKCAKIGIEVLRYTKEDIDDINERSKELSDLFNS